MPRLGLDKNGFIPCVTDIPDVSSMVPDLAWCVAEQLTPQQLFDAEQRPDFLSLNLGMVDSIICHHIASRRRTLSSQTMATLTEPSTGWAGDY